MSDLFGGVLSFNPAFEAERMAIEQGKAVSSAISGGAQAGSQMASQSRSAGKEKDQMKMLDGWMKSRNSAMGSSGDWAGETDSPTPWN